MKKNKGLCPPRLCGEISILDRLLIALILVLGLLAPSVHPSDEEFKTISTLPWVTLPGSQVANGENKPQPPVSEETHLSDSN